MANYLLGHYRRGSAKGWINVLNALILSAGVNHQELGGKIVSVMVFLDKAGTLTLSMPTRPLKAGLSPSVSRVKIYAVAIKEEFCALLRQLVSQTDGEIIEKSFRIKDYAGRLRLQLVAEMSGQRAYVISTNMV